MLDLYTADIPLRQIVGEECVVFMLNWRENDYLTLQVPQSLVNNNPYIKVCALHQTHVTTYMISDQMSCMAFLWCSWVS